MQAGQHYQQQAALQAMLSPTVNRILWKSSSKILLPGQPRKICRVPSEGVMIRRLVKAPATKLCATYSPSAAWMALSWKIQVTCNIAACQRSQQLSVSAAL